jgi:diadenylate cyclase
MVSLFSPGSPLHDGALILRGDQVVAAGCILPLSQNPRLSSVLGTRHRAAVGITEESDAVAVVISEHTQAISVAFRSELRQRLNEGELRSELARVMRLRDEDVTQPEAAPPTPPASADSGDPV